MKIIKKNFFEIKKGNRVNFILLDTNFIYFALKNRIEIFKSLLSDLSSHFVLCVSECVVLELERLGPKFRMTLRVLNQQNIIKISCCHDSSVIYADDCILHTIKIFKHFFLATCDKNLKRRIRKVSQCPIISIKKKKLFFSNLEKS